MNILIHIGLAGILLSSAVSFAGINEGKSKSVTCMGCHGENGIGMSTIFPNLAGQKKDYLVSQLMAFKNDTRQNPMMAPMAKNLSAQDIEDLAAYYESLK